MILALNIRTKCVNNLGGVLPGVTMPSREDLEEDDVKEIYDCNVVLKQVSGTADTEGMSKPVSQFLGLLHPALT
jgi:hypothetical protein